MAIKVSKIYERLRKTDFAYEYVKKEALILKKITHLEGFESSFINRYIDSGDLDAKRFFLIQSLQYYDLYKFQTEKFPNGMPLRKVATIADQLFKALLFLRHPHLEVIHCDVKPHNILVSENKDNITIRLIDFNAAKIGQRVILEKDYIVSRFYRAPEIILKLPYTYQSDLWSAGCLLFELFSAEPLFPASNEAELITMMYELMGPLHESFVQAITNNKKGFMPISGKPGFYEVRPIFYRNPHIEHRKRFFDRILNTNPKSGFFNFFFKPEPVDAHLIQFKEFLLSIFKWNQDERPSITDLQQHPFFLDYFKPNLPPKA